MVSNREARGELNGSGITMPEAPSDSKTGTQTIDQRLVEKWLSTAGESVASLSQTSALATPGIIPSAYTTAMVVLCEQLSNPALKRTRRAALSCFAGMVSARR